jgi:hypothetical protein
MYVTSVQVCQSSFYHSITASTNIVINVDDNRKQSAGLSANFSGTILVTYEEQQC